MDVVFVQVPGCYGLYRVSLLEFQIPFHQPSMPRFSMPLYRMFDYTFLFQIMPSSFFLSSSLDYYMCCDNFISFYYEPYCYILVVIDKDSIGFNTLCCETMLYISMIFSVPLISVACTCSYSWLASCPVFPSPTLTQKKSSC